MRSGTLAPHLCVGLGEAARIAKDELQNDQAHVDRLSQKFYDEKVWENNEKTTELTREKKSREKEKRQKRPVPQKREASICAVI